MNKDKRRRERYITSESLRIITRAINKNKCILINKEMCDKIEINNRCHITGRSRRVNKEYKISNIVLRQSKILNRIDKGTERDLL